MDLTHGLAELASERRCKLAHEHPSDMLSMLGGLARTTDRRKQADKRGMAAFGQRIGGDPRAGVRKRPLRLIGEAPDQGGENGASECAETLALGHAPLVKAMTIGEVEPIEELA